MKGLLAALVVGVWGLLVTAGYHVFIDHALNVLYVCAGPQAHLPDPGPPPSYHKPGTPPPHAPAPEPAPEPEPPK